jgi:hypothetical protein
MFQWRCPGQGCGADDLGQERLGRRVAVQDALFSPPSSKFRTRLMAIFALPGQRASGGVGPWPRKSRG